ncbi:MAG: hypothetical protein HYU39_08995 [Thaumarchaeota archaeon]|nr:hypothetical protein [Nitrososphaerota archaeon]
MASELNLEVHVEKVEAGEVANRLSGYVIIGKEKLSFNAIAFGRWGGQNISTQLPRKTTGRLQQIGVDVEEFSVELQRKLIEGEVVIESKPSRKDWTE